MPAPVCDCWNRSGYSHGPPFTRGCWQPEGEVMAMRRGERMRSEAGTHIWVGSLPSRAVMCVPLSAVFAAVFLRTKSKFCSIPEIIAWPFLASYI